MRQIRTYEGFFDFFKKVDIEVLAKECRRILSNKEGLKEEKKMDGFEWKFEEVFRGERLNFNVKLSRRASEAFWLHIGCQDPNDVDDDNGKYNISDYISFMKDGKELLKDLEFHINHNIKNLSNKVSILMKSKDFFLDHPEDEIRDYIIDLKDTLSDDINLTKDYQRCGWNMKFHISRDSDNFDSVKSEIDEQLNLLDGLLNSVNLKLVDLESKLNTNIKMAPDQKVYGHYNFLICKK